jgi:hypothetical protein
MSCVSLVGRALSSDASVVQLTAQLTTAKIRLPPRWERSWRTLGNMPSEKIRISDEGHVAVYKNRSASEYTSLNTRGQSELSLANITHKIHCLDT